MKTEYVRDFKRNYLVICDEQVLTDDYEFKMMTKNEVNGLLRCTERMINGVGYLYYDVTSKHAFSQVYADSSLKMDTLRKLFGKISNICEDMERYLLYDDGLHLEPDNIFLDADTEEFYFLYYKNDCEPGGNIEELVNYLLERVDGNDIRAVEAVYQMADIVSRSGYALDEILRWFSEEFAQDKEEIRVPPSIPEIVSEQFPEFREELPKKKKRGLFARIRSLFAHGDEEDEEICEDYCEEQVYPEETPVSSNNETVFIPWIENSENKLYGVGKGNKLHIDLNRVPITIGKLKGRVDMVIEDESISRIHAKLTREGNKFFLSDLNSTNGSFRNGLRLNPNQTVVIEPGDEIAFGKLKFIYR